MLDFSTFKGNLRSTDSSSAQRWRAIALHDSLGTVVLDRSNSKVKGSRPDVSKALPRYMHFILSQANDQGSIRDSHSHHAVFELIRISEYPCVPAIRAWVFYE